MDGGGYAMAYGLSTAAGIRPCLMLAISAWLMHDGTLHPAAAFAWLGQDGVCILLSLLAFVEFAGDKIPVLDHLLHLLHFGAKPIAAVLVAGGTVHFHDARSMHEATEGALMVASAANAVGLHFILATARGFTTTFTFGAVNPIVSVVEDILCVVAIAAAILVPIAAAVVAVMLTLVSVRFIRAFFRLVREHRMRAAENAAGMEIGPLI
ncbi:MAG TPA: DUF4126 domain-containing protein [Candidatus Tumulicola sp.]|jgi:hypothetical protein